MSPYLLGEFFGSSKCRVNVQEAYEERMFLLPNYKNTHKNIVMTHCYKNVTIIKLEFAIFDRPQIPILAINLMRDTDTNIEQKSEAAEASEPVECERVNV